MGYPSHSNGERNRKLAVEEPRDQNLGDPPRSISGNLVFSAANRDVLLRGSGQPSLALDSNTKNDVTSKISWETEQAGGGQPATRPELK